MKRLILGLAGLAGMAAAHAAQPVTMMSDEWAAQACAQWNATPALVDELGGSWVRNDGGKGFKLIHLYRSECGEATRRELRIAARKLDTGVDYVMHATTAHWGEMGRGQYGPMRAMMFGALRFSGPKMEAMGVMGPFEQFLLLVGKVAGDTAACPA